MKSLISPKKLQKPIKIKRNYNWSLFQNYIVACEISVNTICDALKNISIKSKSLGKIDKSSKYYIMPSKEDIILFKKKIN